MGTLYYLLQSGYKLSDSLVIEGKKKIILSADKSGKENKLVL